FLEACAEQDCSPIEQGYNDQQYKGCSVCILLCAGDACREDVKIIGESHDRLEYRVWEKTGGKYHRSEQDGGSLPCCTTNGEDGSRNDTRDGRRQDHFPDGLPFRSPECQASFSHC